MEGTTEQVATEQVSKRKGVSGGIIVIAVVLFALVMAAAFYQQELLTYMQLQGWNTGAVKQTVERFVKEAHAGQPSAGDLFDPAWGKPEIKDGKFVGIIQNTSPSGALGPTLARADNFAPDSTIKEMQVRIKNKSKVFQVDVQYPNGKWASFDVDRIKGVLRIRSVPETLSPTKPQVQPWD
jgi:hypothetical protein